MNSMKTKVFWTRLDINMATESLRKLAEVREAGFDYDIQGDKLWITAKDWLRSRRLKEILPEDGIRTVRLQLSDGNDMEISRVSGTYTIRMEVFSGKFSGRFYAGFNENTEEWERVSAVILPSILGRDKVAAEEMIREYIKGILGDVKVRIR